MSILSPKQSTKKQFDFINQTVDKKGLRKLLSKIYSDYGTAKTGTLANSLKNLGFKYATLGGITISIEDLSVPEDKKELLAEAESKIADATRRFIRGDITEVERYTMVIDTWSETTEKLTKSVIDNFSRLNPVYMMAFSGARGNISQVRQLVGMRGLMADSQGQIIDMPIKSNFKEGLSVTEYIISSYGARKGLVDTALKTADSGYLTRRLVDVAQDVIISEADCGSTDSVLLQAVMDGDKALATLSDRIVSRTSHVDVIAKKGEEPLVKAGEIITPEIAEKIGEAGIEEIQVRSALTCATQFGICQQCYGWSLTTNKQVNIGEAIGIMAAQSIGEPGTQLTMRTFHTGGAVSGSGESTEQIKAKADGSLVKSIKTTEHRTRHGEVVQLAVKDCTVELKTKTGVESYELSSNATLRITEKGDKIKAGEIIAELDPILVSGGSRLTEKASKDITTAFGGEVFFEGFDADEKRDRQGNITRTSNRSGTIWILGGDTYNLPAGAKHLVKNEDEVKTGQVLAESLLISENGGLVRIPESLVTEDAKSGKESIKKILSGKELTIIINSLRPNNAELVQTKKERLWQTNTGKGKNKIEETFIIKSPDRTTVENGSIIAELVDDSMSTPTSGEIRYDDLEVDEQRIITKPGKIFFIPEEVHSVSKDSSLKVPDIETGQFVSAGTEVVKGVITRTDGILELVEENDIVREVIIRPGESFRIDDVTTLDVDDGAVVEKGTKVAPKIKAKERCMVTVNFQMDLPEGKSAEDLDDTSEFEYAEVILRPVQEFEVAPRDVNIAFDSTDETNMSMVPVTQIQYSDGDRVRQIEGAPILRTSLIIQMKGELEHMKGLVEITEDGKKGENMQIVVLENLTIRRESSTDMGVTEEATQTNLLVEDGQEIKPKTPLVKTQVLANSTGTVSLGTAKDDGEVRRLLLITPEHLETIKTSAKPSVKKGDYVKSDELLDGKTESPISGQVTKVDAKSVTIREGRPYLIGRGSQLQLENRSLTQRGDLIGTLVFERLKTGDIVQGLPRVEELLEGRKSKDACIIAATDAVVETVKEDDHVLVYLVTEKGREEVQLPVGANVLVKDKQEIKAGQQITDGPINPHELLEAAGVIAVRKYLVDEVQRVYRSQGVEIADKHVEVIVRQMSKKIRVDAGGDTRLMSGELVDERDMNELNKELTKDQTPASGHPILLGITKASLNTESFISAASFQETTRVLTEAAVSGKKDYLRGLKENVIIGRLIPAGTGFPNFIDERQDMLDDQQAVSKSTARKPSAILEEIESMFGSPEISTESLGDLLIDDSSKDASKED